MANETIYKLKVPDHWHIHNAFDINLFEPYEGKSLSSPIKEDPPKFEKDEEVLVPKRILRQKDKILRIGKVL